MHFLPISILENKSLLTRKFNIWCGNAFFMHVFQFQKLVETKIKVKKSLADDFDTIRALDAVLDLINLSNKELRTKPQV